MTKLMLCGAGGKMGKAVARLAATREDCEIVVGVDLVSVPDAGFPVVAAPDDYTDTVDAIVDFSHPSALGGILSYAIERHIPVVLATTGYSEEQIAKINEAAAQIPVFFTFNMSLGINLLSDLANRAAQVLGDAFDVEIIEKHHNQKVDAPSGTAIMLGNAVNEAFDGKKHFVYDRHEYRQKRSSDEIGMHSVRGGSIVGEHEILFAGHDETITLTHQAYSKEVFAAGALSAAVFVSKQTEPKLYRMGDLLEANE